MNVLVTDDFRIRSRCFKSPGLLLGCDQHSGMAGTELTDPDDSNKLDAVKRREFMSFFRAVMCAVTGVFMAGTALAIQPGKSVTWDTPMGKVVFDGKVHADAKVKCLECHSKIFKMKKGSAKFKMADINAGKFCGVCHNGKRSFASNDKDNCDICHKK